MVDLTEQEKAAIRAAMKPVAEIMEEIGWQARFSDLSEAQVLTLIEVVLQPMWVWIVLDEVPHAITMIGGAILLAAIAGQAVAGMATRRGRTVARPA